MAKVGRPKWIPQKEDIDQIEALASRFIKEEQIATILGIGQSTFVEKKKEFPELVEAIKRGRAKVAVNLSNKLYEQAMGGNTAILIFLAKAIMGLRENDPMVQSNQTVLVRVDGKTFEFGKDGN